MLHLLIMGSLVIPRSWPGKASILSLQVRLGISVNIQTDVAVAAIREYWYGSVAGIDRLFYMPVGTGIGEVLLFGGVEDPPKVQRPIEVGHMHVPYERDSRGHIVGKRPYYSDCLDGLASGPALENCRSVVGWQHGCCCFFGIGQLAYWLLASST